MHGLEMIVAINQEATEKQWAINRAIEALRLIAERDDVSDYLRMRANEALQGLDR